MEDKNIKRSKIMKECRETLQKVSDLLKNIIQVYLVLHYNDMKL